jgi:GTP-binding protein
VVLNKIDVPEARELAELVRPDLEARGLQVFEISAVSHEGLRELSFAMAKLVDDARRATVTAVPERIVIRPKAVDDVGFTVRQERTPDGVRFRVRGVKPERWVRQTDFTNDEAVGYLADRLARLGVEDALLAEGAVAGAEVVIGDDVNGVIFDWEPTMIAGPGVLAGPRGTDLRVEEPARPTRDERREVYEAKRVGRRDARAELESERRAGQWVDPAATDGVDTERADMGRRPGRTDAEEPAGQDAAVESGAEEH